MTVEAELIHAIAAAPDDDAPRMVYADHLMQRGDPRGEFIALQCQIARADDADEAIADDVIARERELREAHAAAWTAPLRAVMDAGYVFRRGFVEHVSAWSERDVIDGKLDEVVAAAPLLRSVAVRADVVALPLTPVWERIRSLAFQECSPGPTPAAIEAFLESHAGALRRLQLVNADLGSERAHAWLGARSLEHLGVRAGWHTNKPGKEILSLFEGESFSDLRSLDLAGISLGDVRPLACLPRLERLSLHRCGVSIGNVIELVGKLPALQMLELDDDDRQFGRGPAGGLADLLAAAPGLRRLALRTWQLKKTTAITLAKSPHAASLRRLELDGCQLGDRAATALLDSEHLSNVVWWRITDASVGKDLHALFETRQRLRYSPPVPGYPREVVDHIPHNRIQAIKNYRERTGAGLADSKMAVDRIVEELGFGPCASSGSDPKFLRATTRWCGA